MLGALNDYGAQAALFVCGKRVDSIAGRTLIKEWDDAGHMICNHSYSHTYYHSPKIASEQYIADFIKGESVIKDYRNFTKLYRFAYLKEGDTAEKRDAMRDAMHEHGYANGHVTIDASDWYVDSRMAKRLNAETTTDKLATQVDTTKHRDFLIAHILDRMQYYEQLSKFTMGEGVTHTLLLHHSLINALYLGDLLGAIEQAGWNLTDAHVALEQDAFRQRPDVLPAGESLFHAIMRAKEQPEISLRYPAEDGEYERERADSAGL